MVKYKNIHSDICSLFTNEPLGVLFYTYCVDIIVKAVKNSNNRLLTKLKSSTSIKTIMINQSFTSKNFDPSA